MQPQNNNPALLIVEDYDDARECLAALFKQRGFEVDQARDIREAVALFNARCSDGLPCYDAAIVDVHLPSASGLGFLRAVREVRSELPVFMVTAYHDDYIRHRVMQASAEYDNKPVDPVIFPDKVTARAVAYHATKKSENHSPLKLEDFIVEMMDRVERAG